MYMSYLIQASAGVSYQGRGVNPKQIIKDFGYNRAYNTEPNENDTNTNNGGYRGDEFYS